MSCKNIIISGTIHSGKMLLAYTLIKHPQFYHIKRIDGLIKNFFFTEFGKRVDPNKDNLINNKIIQKLQITQDLLDYYHTTCEAKDRANIIVTSSYKKRIYSPEIFNNPGINMVRDPRIIWILNDHYNNKNSDEQAKLFCDTLEHYVYDFIPAHKISFKTIKHEDLLKFPKKQLEIISNIINIDVSSLKLDSIPLTKYFTYLDIKDKLKDIKEFNNQKILDYISERLENYLDFYNYPKRLTIDKIKEGIFPKKDKSLVIAGISHGGKSFLSDSFLNNGFIFGNEDEQFPACKTGWSIGYTFNYYFIRVFEKKQDIYKTYENIDYVGNRAKKGTKTFLNAEKPNLIKDSRVILLVRDPRVIWVLENHFGHKDKLNHQQCIKYIKEEPLKFFRWYKEYVVPHRDKMVIRFEDYFRYFDRIQPLVFNFIGIYPKLKKSSEPLNKWFTTTEYENSNLFTKQSQNLLDFISEECKEYIKEFNYPEKLTLEEIYEGVDLTLSKDEIYKILPETVKNQKNKLG